MRSKYIINLLLLFTISVINAQLKSTFTKVVTPVKEQKLNELILEKINTRKNNGCLIYNFHNKMEVKYCDDKSDENYVAFDELGKIKNRDVIVLNKFTYNEEFYILINPKENKTLTLYGFPLKIKNSNKYLVYNNPATDIPYTIQILEFKNGKMKMIKEIFCPNTISIKKVLRVNETEIFVLDNKNQTWKTNY